MPYRIVKSGSKYKVKNKLTSKTYGKNKTKAGAIRQERAIVLSMKRRGKI